MYVRVQECMHVNMHVLGVRVKGIIERSTHYSFLLFQFEPGVAVMNMYSGVYTNPKLMVARRATMVKTMVALLKRWLPSIIVLLR